MLIVVITSLTMLPNLLLSTILESMSKAMEPAFAPSQCRAREQRPAAASPTAETHSLRPMPKQGGHQQVTTINQEAVLEADSQTALISMFSNSHQQDSFLV